MSKIITKKTEPFFMRRFYIVCLLAAVSLLSYSCSGIPNKSWEHLIPEKAPFVIIPAEGATLSSTLDAPFIPFLDDITSSALQVVSKIDTVNTELLTLKGIALYPGTHRQLQPLWITNAPNGLIQNLDHTYYEKFTQNQYYFKDITVHRLHIEGRNLYAAQINGLLVFSESSLAVEESIRAYLDGKEADLSGLSLQPASLVLNTPSLDVWTEQLAKTIYRPSIMGAFSGTKPTLLQVTSSGDDEQVSSRSFTGMIPLKESSRSELVSAVSQSNAPLDLDRYISSNAAAFGIFRLSPRLAPPESVSDTTKLDEVLLEDKIRYSKFAKSLDAPFALVMYAESGFLSTGEHLFIRKLKDRNALQAQLNSLVNDGLASRQGGTYYIQSSALAQLIGSKLCTFHDFYLDITGDAVVISKRKGLAEIVASDRSRRRVIYYERTYADLRRQFPKELSGLFVANKDFQSFIQPFLAPNNYVDALTSNFDLLTTTFSIQPNSEQLAFNLTTYTTQKSTQPYQEQWLFPAGGAELSGPPVLANIGGSSRNEVIFATKTGSVYVLAADGTTVLQLSTGSDEPLGSPAIYDWYGTGQNVILLAAGNKIYGWNDTGDLLPKFPFELEETITSPVLVKDIDRNGLPDAVVATANRKLHALDGRGQDIQGWPVTTNALVKTKPVVDNFQGAYSVLAFSENAVHAWYSNGSPRSGFPKFVNASLSGSPLIYKSNVLGGGADGYLYSVGKTKLFSDSLDVYSTTANSEDMQAVYVSNSGLIGTPSFYSNVTIKADDKTVSSPAFLTASSNGSVFLLNNEGRLLFNRSMGQPGAPGFSPVITDLNHDNSQDVVALAGFGRLYAWDLATGERIFDLPTTGMKHIVIDDLDGDGYKEIIAQTRDGVRCWTIYGK